jgi:hypothetical protein
MPIVNKIRSFFNPEQFQGWTQKRKYFEGWYYKIVNRSETKAFAFIPGIAIDETGNKHAFIQVLDGKNKTSEYLRFVGSDFIPKAGSLDISIGKNHFTENHIDLKQPEIQGRITFEGNVPWPKPFYSPGIMGPYAFVPFMECYHGIVSMDHEIKGKLKIGAENIDFTGGRGYIEKDWGQSFPSAYVWMQTNHFSYPGISFKASVAKIPWIKSAFIGFIAGLWFENKLYRFTTYNRTKLKRCLISKKEVHLMLENKKFLLEIIAMRDQATELASPILGMMEGHIEESMTSTVNVKLTDKNSGVIVFNDTGRNAGLEVAGNIKELILQ